jgi:hypothetical protein
VAVGGAAPGPGALRVRRRLAGVVVGLAVVVASLATGSPPAAPAQPQPQPQQGPRPRLSLTAQTPFVNAGGEFSLRIRVDRASVPASAEVAVSVFPAVETRSEFEQTLEDRMSRRPLASVGPFGLGSLQADAAGESTVRLPLQDPGEPADGGRIQLEDGLGVYPVRVELRDRGGISLDRFTTHLIHVPVAPTGPKLGLALVFPVAAGIGLPADGPRELDDLDAVTAGVQAMEAVRALPFTLVPSPETMSTLAGLNNDQATRALEGLRRLAADHPVLSTPYVPVNLPGLLGAGLEEEAAAQLERGMAVVNDVLRTRADRRTWSTSEPIDPEAIDYLARNGVERVVAADAVLEPIPNLSLTLTRPFAVDGREEQVQATVADAGLTSHFTRPGGAVLQAHRLLADLAVLFLDAPGADRRAVVAAAPREWRATRPFVDALAAGVASNPLFEAVPLDAVFASIAPAVAGRGVPLVRDPAPAPAAGLGDVVSGLRQARRRLTSLSSVLAASTSNSALLEERLLVAQSTDIRSSRQRQAYLEAVEDGISDHLDAIEMPQGRSITLTARRAQIPVTFQNRTGSPVRVVVTVQSDKLEFPQGTSRAVELARRNTTERFSVVARTSGVFPLRITLESPDGNLLIGRARLTVRSTAASRVSVVVSVGAAAFLVAWWGRHFVRGRRARRLVPP